MDMTRKEISKILPQKTPFLFIDKLEFLDEKNQCVTCSNSFNRDEFYFSGHFPDNPITPGVILVEAMAQSIIVLLKCLENDRVEENYYLSKIIDMRFRKVLCPDEKVYIDSTLCRTVGRFYFAKSRIYNQDNETIASGELIVAT